MGRSITRRLDKLTASITPASTQDDDVAWARNHILDRAVPWYAGWMLLKPSMDAAHVERIESLIPNFWWWYQIRTGENGRTLTFSPAVSRDDDSDPDTLLRHVNQMIRDAVAGKHQGPFVLPGIVAQCYADDEWATSQCSFECADCGYAMPTHSGGRFGEVKPRYHAYYRVEEDRQYFTSCPLCGGAVAYRGYYFAHDYTESPKYQIGPDALREVRDWLMRELAGLTIYENW